PSTESVLFGTNDNPALEVNTQYSSAPFQLRRETIDAGYTDKMVGLFQKASASLATCVHIFPTSIRRSRSACLERPPLRQMEPRTLDAHGRHDRPGDGRPCSRRS